MADQPTYTAEQYEEALAIVNAEARRREQEALARRIAYWAPVKALVTSEAWGTVVAEMKGITTTYAADSLLSPHVEALSQIMPRLAEIVANTAQDGSYAPGNQQLPPNPADTTTPATDQPSEVPQSEPEPA